MLYHIKSKYTAVGRKEITMFFYLYFAVIILEFLLESNFIQMSFDIYPWFAAFHTGLLSALFLCLLLNGFVGFQFTEDGTPQSLWFFRIACGGIWFISTLVALLTFFGKAGLNPAKPFGLFVIYYVLNGAMLLLYLGLQVILVVRTLNERWPLGDIAFGVFFFAAGQIFSLLLSTPVCTSATHYVDGLFFTTLCSLLAVMMVYKYWDSITREDLEFSVGGKMNVWEVKATEEDPGVVWEEEFEVGRKGSAVGFAANEGY